MTLLSQAQSQKDPYLWLEDVEGEEALKWVEKQNEETLTTLKGNQVYEEVFQTTLDIYNSADRIAYPSIRGQYAYNFWKDEQYPRGVWRRMLKNAYFTGSQEWEILLDIQQLSEAEEVNWVYKGANFLSDDSPLCLVSLSRGGADATEIREFNVEEKTFVEDGFFLPEAKSRLNWLDEETLLVATDFGKGSMTTSGYPRIIKRWTRGTDLKKAEVVYEAQKEDVSAFSMRAQPGISNAYFIGRSVDFFTFETYLYQGGELTYLEIPNDVRPILYQDMLLLKLKSDWGVDGVVYDQGSLIGMGLEEFLKGKRSFELIYKPKATATIESVVPTQDALLLNVLNNVQSELYELTRPGDAWSFSRVEVPPAGSIDIGSARESSNEYLFIYTSFLQPTTLYYVQGPGAAPLEVKRLPDFFEAGGLEVNQYQAESKDGTAVPYFIIHPRGMTYNHSTPTLLYGYGGFEISLTPNYNSTIGATWLSRGYAYVIANIRGGGEFGPAWHQAALKEKRQRAYDDFIAVAEDLIARGITSPQHLGIRGGSNGGLLVGAAFTQRPDLFKGVVCSVPLLDMKRYHKLLAGASWIGEYGNPDNPDEWAYISQYSPYQKLSPDQAYPKVLFVTSTRDDRVHPGHARKMAARMLEYGQEIYYYENTEGGHGAGVTNEQLANLQAVITSYLIEQLVD